MVCKAAQAAEVACLDPLVGVRHHRNQEVDQDDGGDQHVKGKDYLEEIHQAGWVV